MIYSKKKLILRAISLILLGTFCVQEMSHAAVSSPAPSKAIPSPSELSALILNDPSQFEPPLDFSTLKEIYRHWPSAIHNPPSPLIIHIQDAHSNLSGQQNMAGALDELMKKYKTTLVLTEGASREATLDPLKKIIPFADLSRAAKSLLIDGEIAGDEYLNLVSDHPMRLMGIENPDLYRQSVASYAALADKREGILQYLSRVQRAVDKLKKKIYPRELEEYENLSEEKQMARLVEMASPELIQSFPAMGQFGQILESEKEVDFGQANLEQAALFEEISKKVGKETFNQNLARAKQLKDSKLSQLSFFQNTFKIAHENNIDLNAYPHLLKYKAYLQKFMDLNLEHLLDQRTALEDRAYASRLSTSRDAILLRSMDRYLKLLNTAYQIQMTTSDFEFFKANEPDFLTPACLAFLNRALAEQGFFNDLVPYEDVLERGKSALVQFYDSVNQRDLAFMENTERILKEQNQKIAFFISGGYHTQHLKQLFEKRGYSYVVLSPRITSATNQDKYEKHLLSFVRPEKRTLTLEEGERKKPSTPGVLGADLARLVDKNKVVAPKIVEIAGTPQGARFAEILSQKTGVKAELIQESLLELSQSKKGSHVTRHTSQGEGARMADSRSNQETIDDRRETINKNLGSASSSIVHSLSSTTSGSPAINPAGTRAAEREMSQVARRTSQGKGARMAVDAHPTITDFIKRVEAAQEGAELIKALSQMEDLFYHDFPRYSEDEIDPQRVMELLQAMKRNIRLPYQQNDLDTLNWILRSHELWKSFDESQFLPELKSLLNPSNWSLSGIKKERANRLVLEQFYSKNSPKMKHKRGAWSYEDLLRVKKLICNKLKLFFLKKLQAATTPIEVGPVIGEFRGGYGLNKDDYEDLMKSASEQIKALICGTIAKASSLEAIERIIEEDVRSYRGWGEINREDWLELLFIALERSGQLGERIPSDSIGKRLEDPFEVQTAQLRQFLKNQYTAAVREMGGIPFESTGGASYEDIFSGIGLTRKDYYQVLGIDTKANSNAIRSVYRGLARKYHPDVNPGDESAETKFKEINEAYQILSDPEKKRRYDRLNGFGARLAEEKSHVTRHTSQGDGARLAGQGDVAESFDFSLFNDARVLNRALFSGTPLQGKVEFVVHTTDPVSEKKVQGTLYLPDDVEAELWVVFDSARRVSSLGINLEHDLHRNTYATDVLVYVLRWLKDKGVEEVAFPYNHAGSINYFINLFGPLTQIPLTIPWAEDNFGMTLKLKELDFRKYNPKISELSGRQINRFGTADSALGGRLGARLPVRRIFQALGLLIVLYALSLLWGSYFAPKVPPIPVPASPAPSFERDDHIVQPVPGLFFSSMHGIADLDRTGSRGRGKGLEVGARMAIGGKLLLSMVLALVFSAFIFSPRRVSLLEEGIPKNWRLDISDALSEKLDQNMILGIGGNHFTPMPTKYFIETLNASLARNPKQKILIGLEVKPRLNKGIEVFLKTGQQTEEIKNGLFLPGSQEIVYAAHKWVKNGAEIKCFGFDNREFSPLRGFSQDSLMAREVQTNISKHPGYKVLLFGGSYHFINTPELDKSTNSPSLMHLLKIQYEKKGVYSVRVYDPNKDSVGNDGEYGRIAENDVVESLRKRFGKKKFAILDLINTEFRSIDYLNPKFVRWQDENDRYGRKSFSPGKLGNVIDALVFAPSSGARMADETAGARAADRKSAVTTSQIANHKSQGKGARLTEFKGVVISLPIDVMRRDLLPQFIKKSWGYDKNSKKVRRLFLDFLTGSSHEAPAVYQESINFLRQHANRDPENENVADMILRIHGYAGSRLGEDGINDKNLELPKPSEFADLSKVFNYSDLVQEANEAFAVGNLEIARDYYRLVLNEIDSQKNTALKARRQSVFNLYDYIISRIGASYATSTGTHEGRLDGFHAYLLQRLKERVGDQSNIVVVDIGIGHDGAPTTRTLAEMFTREFGLDRVKIYGLDSNSWNVEQANQLNDSSNLQFLVGDFSVKSKEIEIPPADLIIASNVLIHYSLSDAKANRRLAQLALKPGGEMAVARGSGTWAEYNRQGVAYQIYDKQDHVVRRGFVTGDASSYSEKDSDNAPLPVEQIKPQGARQSSPQTLQRVHGARFSKEVAVGGYSLKEIYRPFNQSQLLTVVDRTGSRGYLTPLGSGTMDQKQNKGSRLSEYIQGSVGTAPVVADPERTRSRVETPGIHLDEKKRRDLFQDFMLQSFLVIAIHFFPPPNVLEALPVNDQSHSIAMMSHHLLQLIRRLARANIDGLKGLYGDSPEYLPKPNPDGQAPFLAPPKFSKQPSSYQRPPGTTLRQTEGNLLNKRQRGRVRGGTRAAGKEMSHVTRRTSQGDGARLAGVSGSTSLRSTYKSRAYGKGITAQTIIERAQKSKIALDRINSIFYQIKDKGDLFERWKEMGLLNDAEEAALKDREDENLVLGVWYAVSKDAYPYPRVGDMVWEGTTINYGDSTVVINGVVHGNFLLRGHYSQVRSMVQEAATNKQLILFEQNLGGLYRIGEALEMDDHKIKKMVNDSMRKERKLFIDNSQNTAKHKDPFTKMMWYLMFFSGTGLSATSMWILTAMNSGAFKILFPRNSNFSPHELFSVMLAMGLVMAVIGVSQIPEIRRILKIVFRYTLLPLWRYLIKKLEGAIDFFVRSLYRAKAIAQDAGNGLEFLLTRLHHRFFRPPPTDPFGIAQLVSLESILDPIFGTNQDGRFQSFFRSSLPMPVAQIFWDKIQSHEDLGKISIFDWIKRFQINRFVTLILRSAYMAEWAHQASLTGKSHIRMVVGLAHEEQIAHFLSHPDDRKKILVKYLGQDQYNAMIEQLKQKVSSYSTRSMPGVDEEAAKRIRRQEIIETAFGGCLLVGLSTLLSQLPIPLINTAYLITAIFTPILLFAAVILSKSYKGHSDALRKTVVGISRGLIFFMLTASTSSFIAMITGLGFIYSIGLSVMFTAVSFLWIKMREKVSFSDTQKNALREEAGILSKRMASIGVHISEDELMSHVDRARFYSHMAAFASAKNIRMYVMRHGLLLAAAILVVTTGLALDVYQPRTAWDSRSWPFAKFLSGAVFIAMTYIAQFLVPSKAVSSKLSSVLLSLTQIFSIFIIWLFFPWVIWNFTNGFVYSVVVPGLVSIGFILKYVLTLLAGMTLFVYYKVSKDEKGFYDRGLQNVSLNPIIDESSLRTNAVYYWIKFIAEHEAWRTLGEEDRNLKEAKLSYAVAVLRALERGESLSAADHAIAGTMSQKIMELLGEDNRTPDSLNVALVGQDAKRVVDELIKEYNSDFARIWDDFPIWFETKILNSVGADEARPPREGLEKLESGARMAGQDRLQTADGRLQTINTESGQSGDRPRPAVSGPQSLESGSRAGQYFQGGIFNTRERMIIHREGLRLSKNTFPEKNFLFRAEVLFYSDEKQPQRSKHYLWAPTLNQAKIKVGLAIENANKGNPIENYFDPIDTQLWGRLVDYQREWLRLLKGFPRGEIRNFWQIGRTGSQSQLQTPNSELLASQAAVSGSAETEPAGARAAVFPEPRIIRQNQWMGHQSYLNRYQYVWRWLRRSGYMKRIIEQAKKKSSNPDFPILKIAVLGSSSGEELARAYHETRSLLNFYGEKIAINPSERGWRIQIHGIEHDPEYFQLSKDRIVGKDAFDVVASSRVSRSSEQAKRYAQKIIKTLNENPEHFRVSVFPHLMDATDEALFQIVEAPDIVLANNIFYIIKHQKKNEILSNLQRAMDERWRDATFFMTIRDADYFEDQKAPFHRITSIGGIGNYYAALPIENDASTGTRLSDRQVNAAEKRGRHDSGSRLFYKNGPKGAVKIGRTGSQGEKLKSSIYGARFSETAMIIPIFIVLLSFFYWLYLKRPNVTKADNRQSPAFNEVIIDVGDEPVTQNEITDYIRNIYPGQQIESIESASGKRTASQKSRGGPRFKGVVSVRFRDQPRLDPDWSWIKAEQLFKVYIADTELRDLKKVAEKFKEEAWPLIQKRYQVYRFTAKNPVAEPKGAAYFDSGKYYVDVLIQFDALVNNRGYRPSNMTVVIPDGSSRGSRAADRQSPVAPSQGQNVANGEGARLAEVELERFRDKVVVSVFLMDHGGPLNFKGHIFKLIANFYIFMPSALKNNPIQNIKANVPTKFDIEKFSREVGVKMKDQILKGYNLFFERATNLNNVTQSNLRQGEVEGLKRDYLFFLNETERQVQQYIRTLDSARHQASIKAHRVFIEKVDMSLPVAKRVLFNVETLKRFLGDDLRGGAKSFELGRWLNASDRIWMTKVIGVPAANVRVNAPTNGETVFIHADPYLLHMALERIISNGFHAKRGENFSDSAVLIDYQKTVDGRVEITISNPGTIQDQELLRIHSRTVLPRILTLNYNRQNLSHGIGLPFAAQAIYGMGGKILIRQNGDGANATVEFVVNLPAGTSGVRLADSRSNNETIDDRPETINENLGSASSSIVHSLSSTASGARATATAGTRAAEREMSQVTRHTSQEKGARLAASSFTSKKELISHLRRGYDPSYPLERAGLISESGEEWVLQNLLEEDHLLALAVAEGRVSDSRFSFLGSDLTSHYGNYHTHPEDKVDPSLSDRPSRADLLTYLTIGYFASHENIIVTPSHTLIFKNENAFKFIPNVFDKFFLYDALSGIKAILDDRSSESDDYAGLIQLMEDLGEQYQDFNKKSLIFLSLMIFFKNHFKEKYEDSFEYGDIWLEVSRLLGFDVSIIPASDDGSFEESDIRQYPAIENNQYYFGEFDRNSLGELYSGKILIDAFLQLLIQRAGGLDGGMSRFIFYASALAKKFSQADRKDLEKYTIDKAFDSLATLLGVSETRYRPAFEQLLFGNIGSEFTTLTQSTSDAQLAELSHKAGSRFSAAEFTFEDYKDPGVLAREWFKGTNLEETVNFTIDHVRAREVIGRMLLPGGHSATFKVGLHPLAEFSDRIVAFGITLEDNELRNSYGTDIMIHVLRWLHEKGFNYVHFGYKSSHKGAAAYFKTSFSGIAKSGIAVPWMDYGNALDVNLGQLDFNAYQPRIANESRFFGGRFSENIMPFNLSRPEFLSDAVKISKSLGGGAVSFGEREFKIVLGRDKYELSRVYVQNGQVLGVVAVSPGQTGLGHLAEVYIHDFIVKAGEQGRGIGTKLLHAVADTVLSRNISDRIYLEVETGNSKAIQFYRSIGFQPANGSENNSKFVDDTDEVMQRGREFLVMFALVSTLLKNLEGKDNNFPGKGARLADIGEADKFGDGSLGLGESASSSSIGSQLPAPSSGLTSELSTPDSELSSGARLFQVYGQGLSLIQADSVIIRQVVPSLEDSLTRFYWTNKNSLETGEIFPFESKVLKVYTAVRYRLEGEKVFADFLYSQTNEYQDAENIFSLDLTEKIGRSQLVQVTPGSTSDSLDILKSISPTAEFVATTVRAASLHRNLKEFLEINSAQTKPIEVVAIPRPQDPEVAQSIESLFASVKPARSQLIFVFTEERIFDQNGKLAVLSEYQNKIPAQRHHVTVLANPNPALFSSLENKGMGFISMPEAEINAGMVEFGSYALAALILDIFAGRTEEEAAALIKLDKVEQILCMAIGADYRDLELEDKIAMAKSYIRFLKQQDGEFYRRTTFAKLGALPISEWVAGARLITQAVGESA